MKDLFLTMLSQEEQHLNQCTELLVEAAVLTHHNPEAMIRQWKSNMKRDGASPVLACINLLKLTGGMTALASK